MASERFSRQCILPEVGREGQERLAQSRFVPREGTSAWARQLSETYALAAGWGEVSDVAEARPSLSVIAAFRHAAPAEVAAAAADVLHLSLPLFSLTEHS